MKVNFVMILSLIVISIICGCAEEIKVTPKNCQDYAFEMIPDNINLVRYYFSAKDNDYFWAYIGNEKSYVNPNITLYWKDNTKFDMKTVCFMSGKTTGRFVDHYYNATCSAGNNPLTYRKMITTQKGQIVGYASFTLVPELIPIEGSEGYVKIFPSDKEESKTMQFEFFEKNVTNFKENYIKTCTWYLENGTMISKNGTMTIVRLNNK